MLQYKSTDLTSLFKEEGVVKLLENECIFSKEEWGKIENIINDPLLPFENIQIGDVGEPNSLDVARFMVDINIPTLVNENYSTPLFEIIGSAKAFEFYRYLFNTEELYIRRCQLNKMYEKGSFIGKHLDVDSNPDYLAAIIIHFNGNYNGGEFIYYKSDSLEGKTVIGEPRSLLISNCLIPHEVTRLNSGERKTLVYFLSKHNMANKRSNVDY